MRMGRRKYASLVDLKAGYHNIPFDPATAPLATFITHKGKYRWQRMPFGLTNAPAHFQWCMEQIVHGRSPDGQLRDPLNCDIYLDDFTVSDDDLDTCLDHTF